MPSIPKTEGRSPAAPDLDRLSGAELAALMARANREACAAFEAAQETIGAAIEALAARLKQGGALVLLGAGTSGRLAVLEAAECPPTFDTPRDKVRAVMAGGEAAFTAAIEGAEDDEEAGARAVSEVRASDVVVGISASGGAPFVRGALMEAQKRGALTLLVTSNPEAADLAERLIVLDTGPEVLAGSTRLKAATAAKMALNALTTGAMARLGRVYGSYMVEVRPTNAKLEARARRLIVALGQVSAERAAGLLTDCDGDVKAAIVCARLGLPAEEAGRRLADCGRRLRELIG